MWFDLSEIVFKPNYMNWYLVELFEIWSLMFILKWVNFLGHSFNLKCDKEFVLIMFNGMRYAIVIIDVYVQCLPMYFWYESYYIGWNYIFLLLIDFFYSMEVWCLIWINGTLLDYKKFGAWEFYKLGDESNW